MGEWQQVMKDKPPQWMSIKGWWRSMNMIGVGEEGVWRNTDWGQEDFYFKRRQRNIKQVMTKSMKECYCTVQLHDNQERLYKYSLAICTDQPRDLDHDGTWACNNKRRFPRWLQAWSKMKYLHLCGHVVVAATEHQIKCPGVQRHTLHPVHLCSPGSGGNNI